MSLARRILWAMTAAYWVAIFVATHLPPEHLPRPGVRDKTAHFFAYLGLSFLVGTTLWLAYPRGRRVIPLLVLVIGAAYGAFDEITQGMVRRHPSVDDWLADCAGAAVAAGILLLAQRVGQRHAAVPEE
jgi:VanZ family protein